ncbi:MAG: hypothetical protein HKN76_17680, partial [Saprospiraceae bacterium]|nr:hypothetical protein [Saprospiraceae bacterium]
ELNKGDALLSLSNAVFWDKSRITPHDDFLDYISSFFTAGAFDLTFKDPNALDVINAWVNTSTQGRIEKIMEEISPEEVLFIINALYFKDDWKYPFPIEATQLRDFTRSDGSIVPTDMMHQDISTLRFYQGSDFSAVELPFADSSYTLTLLLPTASSSPDELVAELSATRLQSLFDKDLKQGRILLNMPKFQIEYKLLLNDVLKSMGMQLAFDPNRANLSKLGSAPEGNLYISRVNHKTYLKVDEKGAEGAAVTSIGVGVTSLPPQLNFDRPHVFVLRNQGTGSLIFAGKIEDPSGS